MSAATSPLAPMFALAHHLEGLADELTPLEWAALAYDRGFWLRPDQREPPGAWRYWGHLAGRGFGKTFTIAPWIVEKVALGSIRDIALLAQDEQRSDDLQVQALIAASPPWFPAATYKGAVVWPNGATARVYTPESPGKVRGFNGDLAWLSELVAWPHTTRKEAFDNVLTATRVGQARVIWDTTSKGRNELIEYLLANHEDDPVSYPITRGTIFDNPLLGRSYLREQCRLYTGRRFAEELEGKVFSETEGALWQQSWIVDHRRNIVPSSLELIIVGLDPAISVREGTDDTGIVVGGRDKRGEIYVLRDRTGKHTPEQYAQIVVDEYLAGAAGANVETNRGGMTIAATIRAAARERGIEVRVLSRSKWAPFPRRTPGVLYIRETHSRGTKHSRGGGPSALYSQGLVHHVGVLSDLEYEQTTYEPGTAESPNRYDACNQMITELAELESNKPSPRARQDQAAGEVTANEHLRKKLLAMGRGRSVL